MLKAIPAFMLLSAVLSAHAQTAPSHDNTRAASSAMDSDLLEVTVPQLQQFYRERRYTVTQVVHWYIARIRRYNGVYGAIENLDAKGALETAARLDAEAK
jgi:amidase